MSYIDTVQQQILAAQGANAAQQAVGNPAVPGGASGAAAGAGGAVQNPAVTGGINGIAGGVIGATSNKSLTPIDFGDMYGGGGFGGGGGANLAAQRKALIEQRKNEMIGGINTRYDDMMKGFDEGEALIRKETDANKGFINTNRDQAIERANQGQADATRQARRNYQDSVLLNRRRIRAAGAGSSSGYLELSNLLDRELSSNLTGINVNSDNIRANATQVAQKALADLDLALEKAITAIAADRRTSAREKEQAIREAEMAAADQALAVDEWVASAAARGGGGRGPSQAQINQQNQNAVMAAYTNDLARIQSGNLRMSVEELNAQYAPQFAGVGANVGNVQDYAGFMGFGGGGMSDDEKYLMDLQYRYDALGARQNDPMEDFFGYYDPYKYGNQYGGFNPAAMYMYPDMYNQFTGGGQQNIQQNIPEMFRR